MKITRQDIKQECGSTYYGRGVSYFVSGRVSQLEIEEEFSDYISFHAMVQGSGSYPYLVNITIEGDQPKFSYSDITLDGNCSCPIGFNCKHVVAACLKLLDSLELFPGQASNSLSWLDSLANKTVPAVPDNNNKIHFLIYLLQYGAKNGIYELSVKYSYHKQNGGLIKPRNLANALMFESFVGNYLEHDREALRMLNALTQYHAETSTIVGKLGAYLIQQVVKTGHCYWLNYKADQPFTLGPTETMELRWQPIQSGNIQLQPVFESPSMKLLLTDPVLYIDIKNRLIGSVKDPGFSMAQLETILNAPALPETAVKQFSRRLAISYPQLNIPKPTPVTITNITAEGMTPRLTLFQTTVKEYQFHALKLQFNYADHPVEILPRLALTRLERGLEIFQIQRDLEREDKWILMLKDLGFKLVSDNGQPPFFYSAAASPIQSATRWHQFIEHEIPRLEKAGWELIYDESYALSFEQPDDWYAGLEETGNDWFELRFDIDINGQKHPMVPLIAEILDNYLIDDIPETLAIPISANDHVLLQKHQIMPVVQTLQELFNYESAGESFRISKYDAAQLAELEAQHEQLQIKGARELLKLGQKLRDFSGIKSVKLPESLGTKLRDYQQTGVEWLQFLREYDLNGILADDMGLGKTVQVLTHLLIEQEQGRLAGPCLIIAPTSLMSNWRRETERFTPGLKLLTLQGTGRHERFDSISDFQIVLSTYPLLPRDHERLKAHDWYYVILDEAQMVKNPKARASKIIRQLKARHRLCLTGTPMENHLGELWSLYDFLMPGFLSDERTFNTLFRTPIEKHGQQDLARTLARRVAPFLLRRTKDEVLKDLPAKSELTRSVELGEAQSKLYESIRISMERKVRSAIAKNGLARSHITILDALLKLRQVCCDPRLLKLTQAGKVKHSAKLELLMDMLPEMLEEGRRVLLFSQFTSMLALIEPELEKQGITYSKLTGQTRKREQVIDEFKSGKTDVFLISLKAGGLGLNLTEADTVIIYDPWWNPAVEAQAADRTHRIGQNKAVFIYKLIVENSVEEKILALQDKKKLLAEGIYGKGKTDAKSIFNETDLAQLFAPLR